RGDRPSRGRGPSSRGSRPGRLARGATARRGGRLAARARQLGREPSNGLALSGMPSSRRPDVRPSVPDTQAPFLQPPVRDKRVIVCCGAGGVGKTTTAAAIGVASAVQGRRALVLTIDPARRLAEAMGLPEASRAPTAVSRAKLTTLGVPVAGSLDAWML